MATREELLKMVLVEVRDFEERLMSKVGSILEDFYSTCEGCGMEELKSRYKICTSLSTCKHNWCIECLKKFVETAAQRG